MAPISVDTDPLAAREEFDFDDLDLTGLSVSVMRDTAALPETGASSTAVCSCSSSCSCCVSDNVQ